ncbi:putative glutathione S-transferase [Fusarium oxysporum f. sp. albedinis]|nr:putative glutathione S-transferase [Fusarium oxysporum f. sp. albedinis]
MRLCADDMLDELDGIAVTGNFARTTCFDVQDDVLETTVGLATSRAGTTWGKGRPALSVDASGHSGCSR